MTNEEAIKSMRNLDDIISITESEHESVKTAISALEHNSLLIEHISNLQNENTDFFNKLVELEQENTKLKVEIEQLKAELEQCKNRQAISERAIMIQGLNDFCDKFELCSQCIFYGRCADFDELSFEEIKSQLEEAEQSLKGATNE